MTRTLTKSEIQGAISILHGLNRSGESIMRGLSHYGDPVDDIVKTIKNNERLIAELTSQIAA